MFSEILQYKRDASDSELKLNKVQKIFNYFNDSESKSITELAKQFENLDDKIIGYLRTVKSGKTDIEDFKNYQMSWGQAIKENTIGINGFIPKLASFGKTILSIGGNMVAMMAIAKSFELAFKIVDSLVVTQAELDKAVSDAVNSISDSESKIEDLKNQLDDVSVKIDELNSKEHLSFTETSELERLKETRKELETLLSLEDNLLDNKQRELALAQADAYGKYHTYSHDRNNDNGTTVLDDYKQTRESYKFNNVDSGYLFDDESTDISTLLVGYEQLGAELSKLKEGTEAWANKYSDMVSVSSRLKELLAEQYTVIDSIRPIYNEIAEKQKSNQPLSSDEKDILYVYEDAQAYADLILQITDPNTYNQIKFDEIFDIEGIELTKEKLIELLKAGELVDLGNYPILAKAIKDIDFASTEGKTNLEIFNQELKSLITSENEIDFSFDIADGMSETVEILDDMADRLTQLADLKDALNGGWTLGIEEAREFANVFPEIFNNAVITRDGLIKLDEDIANNFITAKEAEIKADGTAREQVLLNAKSELEGKKAEAEAKLELANAVANGELKMSREQIELMAQGRQQLIDYLIECGATQVEAEQAANAAMQGDMILYNKLVGQVADETSNNLANALADAATNSKTNMDGMIVNANAANKAFAALAKQIKAASSGEVTGEYNGKASAGGSKTKTTKSTLSVVSTPFNAIKGIISSSFNMPDYIDKIELDLSEYNQAISKIDAQLALISSGKNTPLSKYSSGKYAPEKQKKNKENKSFSKTFDWLSIALDNISDKIKKLGNTASNVYKTWSQRNTALSSELTNLVDQLELQQSAYATYINKAESLGLSDHYKNLVQNGALSIETITDEALASKIEEYQNWYNSAREVLSSIQETEKAISDIYSETFDNVSKEYDDKIDFIESFISQVEKSSNLAESKGLLASASYYKIMLQYQEENLANLEAEQKALTETLQKALDDQSIVQYSESWFKMQGKIEDVNELIVDVNQSIVDFQNTIRDIEWSNFDYLQDTISQITTEADFLISLMENNKMFDDEGNQTEYNKAIQALHGVNYNTYMSQADEYAKSISELDKQYKDDSLNKDYLERRQELVELQQDMISNAQNEKEAIKDLVRDGYETQLDSIKELIELNSELRNSTKDLYEYQKAIAEKTKTISQIQKQLGSYATDNSEEAKKTVQELKVELQKAQDDLEETEYDKYISDQEALLDKFVDDYELWMNERLDSFDETFSEIIDKINENSTEVAETIKNSANEVGYNLSDSFNTIFNAKDGEIANIINNYDSNFSSRMTTLQSAIDAIKSGIDYMASQSKAEADRIEAEQKAKEEVIKQQQAQQNQNQNQNSSSNGSGAGGSGGSSGGGDKSIFVHKKDTYPKGKLDRYQSLVDALKYFDFDSSFNMRKIYYDKLGGSGTYVGNSRQNSWMLSNFRNIMGYSTGGIVGSLKTIARSNGDDSITINTLQKGEGIIPLNMMPKFDKFVASLPSLNNLVNNQIGNGTPTYNFNGMEIVLPNVTNYEEFKSALITDTKFNNAILTKVNTTLTGGNSLSNRRFMR
ncbi:hypothetical protein SAMN04489758_101171 [Thomasclavelia cocleata]|uniref:Uncharacterized protein n=1 Tax=Thomasclavelia cocleata TaxID=69824 RepID=A0A1I0BL11_9FIRM|nr:hypothetical protein [Thomasclavelia cocleata]MCR1960194.1 hypothetical protein [Thomasclavelia cocleata]NDO41832.1 hypothetical protein [Thomasclavelia cocleata]SET07678.1 hypothetical protein SAMN04489758_101171 [Thomasclavelia cocleata]